MLLLILGCAHGSDYIQRVKCFPVFHVAFLKSSSLNGLLISQPVSIMLILLTSMQCYSLLELVFGADSEVMKASQQAIERGVKDCLFIDYKRRSGHFDVTTVASIKEITDKVRPVFQLTSEKDPKANFLKLV